MQMGQIIRKYRKTRRMTQEEMARRLGVTAPAVNKWENDKALPDVSMLAPIARLLQVSLDELLGYQKDLTKEEIVGYVQELERELKTLPYEEAFARAGKIMETYPDCLWLIWQFAVLLDAHRVIKGAAGTYETYIVSCYHRVLESEDEKLRTCAADSLFNYYLGKQEYEKAEACLKYYSDQNPEKRRKQGMIHSKTGRTEEAYKTYEELLFFGYQMLNTVFQSEYLLAMEEGNLEKACYLTEKQSGLARLFEMGEYHETACRLDLEASQKDGEAVREISEKLMSSLDSVTAFCKSPLYEHMTFKEVRPEFLEDLRKNLRESLDGIDDGQ